LTLEQYTGIYYVKLLFPAVHAGFPDLQGHYILIRALFASYNYIPVGTGVFGEDMVNDIVRFLETYF